MSDIPSDDYICVIENITRVNIDFINHMKKNHDILKYFNSIGTAQKLRFNNENTHFPGEDLNIYCLDLIPYSKMLDIVNLCSCPDNVEYNGDLIRTKYFNCHRCFKYTSELKFFQFMRFDYQYWNHKRLNKSVTIECCSICGEFFNSPNNRINCKNNEHKKKNYY